MYLKLAFGASQHQNQTTNAQTYVQNEWRMPEGVGALIRGNMGCTYLYIKLQLWIMKTIVKFYLNNEKTRVCVRYCTFEHHRQSLIQIIQHCQTDVFFSWWMKKKSLSQIIRFYCKNHENKAQLTMSHMLGLLDFTRLVNK